MGAGVVGLAVLLCELAGPASDGAADLVADARLDEDGRRLVLRLDAQRLHLVDVGGDDVAAQGKGVALDDREAHLEAGALLQGADVVLGRVVGRASSWSAGP